MSNIHPESHFAINAETFGIRKAFYEENPKLVVSVMPLCNPTRLHVLYDKNSTTLPKVPQDYVEYIELWPVIYEACDASDFEGNEDVLAADAAKRAAIRDLALRSPA